MFFNLKNILLTDCVVVKFGQEVVYPIFKNGYSSLVENKSGKKFYNQDTAKFDNINVVIREPNDRFVKGFKEYCYLNNLQYMETYKQICQHDQTVMDKHFTPQFLWLLHLNKFYKGNVTIRKMDWLSNVVEHAANQSKWQYPEKQELFKSIDIEPLPEFTEIDRKLMQHYDQTVSLNYLIRKYKNVLPKA